MGISKKITGEEIKTILDNDEELAKRFNKWNSSKYAYSHMIPIIHQHYPFKFFPVRDGSPERLKIVKEHIENELSIKGY